MTFNPTKEEEKVLIALRRNPDLGKCVFEMLDIVGEDLGGIELADEAEELVVENIRKTGHELLTTWAQKRANLAAEETRGERGTRAHEKKNSNGIQPSE